MMIGLYLLLNLAVLWFAARSSSGSGWRLVLMLLLAGWVVGSGNSLIEALFFHVLTFPQACAAGAVAAVVFALLAPVAVLTAGRWTSAVSMPRDGGLNPVSLLVVIVAYELLYWGAGTLVYPYIAQFYASRSLPPVFAVTGVQVVRSLIFVGAVYPLLRSSLRRAPLVLALVYGIIGGLAPLLPDNPYMPPDIRFYHAIETTTSNFIFGLIVGLLFGWRRPAAAQA
jgi:hypothetical protein